VPCELEYTDEFWDWWESLSDAQQRSVAHVARLLEEKGPNLPFPYSSKGFPRDIRECVSCAFSIGEIHIAFCIFSTRGAWRYYY